ncbi:MAG: hypothetical protein JW797_19090 [Bradymonadales bacterium]|nr:hypothetical protein [Bradymonadales bacterium]
MLTALDRYLDGGLQIVLVSPEIGGDPTPFLNRVGQSYLPYRLLIAVREGPDLERHRALAPILAHRAALGGQTTAYVCRQGSCQRPATELEAFGTQLALEETRASAIKGR